jgi:hypothetical protein
LTGTVNPGGLQTHYLFGYGTTSFGEFDAGSSVMVAGNTPQPVTAQISGLTPGTTYHVRLLANNSAARRRRRCVPLVNAPILRDLGRRCPR